MQLIKSALWYISNIIVLVYISFLAYNLYNSESIYKYCTNGYECREYKKQCPINIFYLYNK